MSKKLMCGLAAVLLAAAVGQVRAETAWPDLEMELTLRGALDAGEPKPESASMLVELSRYGDRWGRLWGVARNYNVGIHPGRVETATISGDTITLELSFKVEGDSWVPGGRAVYKVEARRNPDGTIAGKHTGVFNGKNFAGEVLGRVKPSVKAPTGFVPIKPGEHPRILFREPELPELRKRAQTPFGKRLVESMGDPKGAGGNGDAIGMGVRYQLSGEKKWADMAMESVERHMADMSGGALAIGRAWAGRQEQVAVAYDLCYDVWPADFRKKVESYLRWITYRCFYDQTKISRTFNWNVQSNYGGPVLAGSAHAGLALWGEKGPEPAKPAPPAAVVDIAAAADFKPGKGVPVVPLEVGKGIKEWLATKPLDFAINTDPMLSLDGMEKLRNEPGTKFNIDDNDVEFQPLDAKHVLPQGGISLKEGLKKDKAVTLFFYTVIDNPQAQNLKVRLPFSRAGRTQMVINGVRVAHEQVIHLQKGQFPMLVALRLGATWGSLEPWLEQATDADIEKSKEQVKARQAEYEAALRDYEFDLAEWKRLGGADIDSVKTMEMSRRIMYIFARDAVGTGGYLSESGGYFGETITQGSPAAYATAYKRVWGRDLSPFNDMSMLLPRLVMTEVIGADGKERSQRISNKVHFNADVAAQLYPVTDERYKPAVLWAWRREMGGTAENPEKYHGAVHTFLNYPLEGKGEEPGKVMPLTWAATDFGHFTFRNGWTPDATVFQVLARQKAPGGWGGPDAGGVRLMGLGQVWGTGNEDREVRRWLESVVVLPENPELSLSNKGRVTHSWFEKNGSGGVTINLDDLGYDSKDKASGPRYETYGGMRMTPTKKPLVSSLRSVAVDYSGASGAPVLLAMVDKVDGGKTKQWLWQVTDTNAAKPSDNGFVMTQGDATLQATFVSPAKVKVVSSAEGGKTTKSAGSNAGSEIIINTKAVRVTGEDPTAGHFFVVMTLQRGAAPKVEATGSGLDAAITVGGRVVKFDGEKILFSNK